MWKKRIDTLILTCIHWLFGITIACSILFIFINSSRYFHVAPFNILGVLFFLCTLLIGFYLLYKLNAKYQFLEKNSGKIIAVISIIVIVWQLFFVSQTYMRIGWDNAIVVDQASGAESRVRYFMQYPNNVLLTFIFKYLLMVSQLPIWHTLSIFNLVIVDLAVALTCVCSQKLMGTKSSTITFLLSVLMLLFFPFLIVPYTDTLAMLFPPLQLLLLIKADETKRQNRKHMYYFSLGFSIMFGFLIKPTTLIFTIATSIIFLFTKTSKVAIKKTFVYLSCLLLVIGGCIPILLKRPIQRNIIPGEHTQKEYDGAEYPMTHFLMMGLLDTENGKFGGYNNMDDMNTYFKIGKAKKTAYHKEVIKERVKAFGFIGLLRHFFDKYIWSTTDGTFFYGGEGQIFAYIEPTDNPSRLVLQNITDWTSPFYRNILINFQQACWLLILFGCLLSKRKQYITDEQTISYLSIIKFSLLGLSLFLMLFEARSRYLLPFLPFYILMASNGIVSMINKE